MKKGKHFKSRVQAWVAMRNIIGTKLTNHYIRVSLLYVHIMHYHDIIYLIQDHTTYLLKAPAEIRGTGYMWRALEQTVPEVKEEVTLMRMCQDRQVKFDVIKMEINIS